jgi:hypothetical protein
VHENFKQHHYYYRTDSDVIDVDEGERKVYDNNHSQSCSGTLESIEGYNTAHTTQNHASHSPVKTRKEKGETNTEINKVFSFRKRKHLLDATEHTFVGYAKTKDIFVKEASSGKTGYCKNNNGRGNMPKSTHCFRTTAIPHPVSLQSSRRHLRHNLPSRIFSVHFRIVISSVDTSDYP